MLVAVLAGNTDTHTLLRRCVQRCCGIGELPRIERGPQGKPYFVDRPGLHFSLSDSGEYALCALSDRPVGADVECVRRKTHLRLLPRLFSPAELAWLEENGGTESAILTLWTRKESAVKYLGTGLTLPTSRIDIPVPPAERWQGLFLQSCSGEDFRACVCGEEKPERWIFL